MRDAESVRQDILSKLMQMFMDDGSEGHEDELDFYECKFLRALRFLRIDRVRKKGRGQAPEAWNRRPMAKPRAAAPRPMATMRAPCFHQEPTLVSAW